jgi:hypothetical protein
MRPFTYHRFYKVEVTLNAEPKRHVQFLVDKEPTQDAITEILTSDSWVLDGDQRSVCCIRAAIRQCMDQTIPRSGVIGLRPFRLDMRGFGHLQYMFAGVKLVDVKWSPSTLKAYRLEPLCLPQ